MSRPALTLLRHAAVLIDLGGQCVLVDPMLDAVGERDAIENSPQPRRNPLVTLPANAEAELARVTAAVVTHLHADHLDASGTAFLNAAAVPVAGQAEDLATLSAAGIVAPTTIGSSAFGGVQVTRTGGRHGVGALADLLAPVSGVVLGHADTRIYVAGDTVPCAAFDDALREHRPTVLVLNAGGARFLEGEPITMTAADVVAIAQAHPDTIVVAVHMDAINHCVDTRDVLWAEIARVGVTNVRVPGDGERVAL